MHRGIINSHVIFYDNVHVKSSYYNIILKGIDIYNQMVAY